MTAEVVSICDASSGASAEIFVSLGFNCFRFHVPGQDDKPLEVLWSIEDFASGAQRPSSSGIPVLFPFPGRIQGTALSWQGQQYELEASDGRGNAIHGFVHARPWRLLTRSDKEVTGQFHASVDDAAILDRWPADFRITATYRVEGRNLHQHFLIENPSDQRLPCGLGTHPYFRLPLGGAAANDCVVRLPVSTTWPFVDMLTTGEHAPLDNAPRMQSGQKFGEMQFDDCFGGLQFEGGQCAADIFDPDSRRRVTISFDNAFRECVVFTPPHREAICIEPYTCPPDPFRLTDMGIDAGLRVLEPGEKFQANVTIHVE